MSIDKLINKIDDELLVLYDAPNIGKYKWFDFKKALEMLNDFIQREGAEKKYNKKVVQYIYVFNDLCKTVVKYERYRNLSYDGVKNTLTIEWRIDDTIKSTMEVKSIEVAPTSKEYVDSLTLPEEAYREPIETVKIDYILADCEIDSSTFNVYLKSSTIEDISDLELNRFIGSIYGLGHISKDRFTGKYEDFKDIFDFHIDTSNSWTTFERYVKSLKAERSILEDTSDNQGGTHRTALFPESLLAGIYHLCSGKQFTEIGSKDFFDAISNPQRSGSKLSIRSRQKNRVYHLIRELRDFIEDDDKGSEWLENILNKLDIENTYYSKYSIVGGDSDVESENWKFKNSLEEVFSKNKP